MPNKTAAAATTTVSLEVNGREYSAAIRPDERLVDLLRDRLSLMGTKEGCGIGECGACTVIMNGKTVNSCMVPAGSAQGAKILTIEGVESPSGELHPIQQSYIDAGAVQCGFCTPGMMMQASHLLDKHPHADEAAIKRGIEGNICRCTGYKKIVDAIVSVGNQEKGV